MALSPKNSTVTITAQVVLSPVAGALASVEAATAAVVETLSSSLVGVASIDLTVAVAGEVSGSTDTPAGA